MVVWAVARTKVFAIAVAVKIGITMRDDQIDDDCGGRFEILEGWVVHFRHVLG